MSDILPSLEIYKESVAHEKQKNPTDQNINMSGMGENV